MIANPLDPLYDAISAGTLEPSMAEMAKSASPLCLALSVDDEIVAYPHIRLIDHYIVSLTNLQLYRDGPGPEADVWTRTIEGQGDWQLAGTGLEVALSDQVFLAEETRYTRPGSGPDAGQDDEVVLRLLLVAPPRHGKSTEVTEWLPKWFLVRYPTAPILLSTYSGDFAEKWGASHKDFLASNKAQLLPLASDGLPLTPITATNSNISFRPGKDRGEINYRGTSGSQTGTGFALGITDDPNKDAEEALSEAHRLSKSNTYTSVFGSRRTQLRGLPPPLEVMMLTRWHEGDLAGVFALEEDGETPKRGWCALRLPAVAEPGGNDPLGREEGQSLCPQIASKDFLETRLREDPVWFSCIYQGSPIHAQGNFFKKTYEGAGGQLTFHHHRYDPSSRRYRGPGEAVIEADAESTVHFMVLDLATSKRTKADWTVFSHWAFDPWLNTLVLVDRVKDRFSTDEHSGVLTDFVTAQAHKPLVIGIEDKTFGTGLINELRADKPEWVIVPLKADRDKISRGTPYSSAVNGGHVWFPDPLLTPWGVNWENEHTNFPRGTHDDQVDCGAYAWFHSRTYLRPGERGPGEPAAELPVPTHVQRGMAQVRRRQGRKEHPYNQLLRNAQVGGL